MGGHLYISCKPLILVKYTFYGSYTSTIQYGAVTEEEPIEHSDALVDGLEEEETENHVKKVAAEEDARGHGQGLGQVRRHL